MRETCQYGSVPGAVRKGRSYGAINFSGVLTLQLGQRVAELQRHQGAGGDHGQALGFCRSDQFGRVGAGV